MDKHNEEMKQKRYKLSQRHHMAIPWDNFTIKDVIAKQAHVKARASIVGRIGIQMLSCGTGAWRVRDAMDHIARALGMTCSADIGLTSIEYTCFDSGHSYTQVLSLPKTGVNTDKLNDLEQFVNNFKKDCMGLTVHQIHQKINKIQQKDSNYSDLVAGLAAAIACCGFIFLLGGGPVEMFCAFIGAGIGNYARRKLIDHKITTIACIAIGVAVASLGYLISFKALGLFFRVSPQHEAGYIGAMLFVIPGFPFITSMLDISKSDMRSGLERLAYATMITIVATLVAWLMAMIIHFKPANFMPLGLNPWELLLLRLPASFMGVYGFSIMFNSPQKMAITAGLIGAVANTLRLELVDLTAMPPAAAAFCGALTAGLLASVINHYNGFPRISLTVPSIVIMVPGLYIYRAVYNIGLNNIGVGSLWLTRAILIIMFLPLGLFVARILLDKDWLHVD